MVADLCASRELAWRLLVRDISALYRQTLGGYFWALFPPLVASGTFIVLNSSGIVNVEGLEVPYAVYVLLGTILWQVLVESILEPLKAVIESKPILARIDFPKEALILAIGLLIVEWLSREKEHPLQFKSLPRAGRWAIYYALCTLLILKGNFGHVPFIYFQF
jgi:hypothetical protein